MNRVRALVLCVLALIASACAGLIHVNVPGEKSMAVVPVGSLMFAGFGNGTPPDPRFTDPDGNVLTPSANQTDAISTDILFDDAGRLLIVSGSSFTIYDSDLTTILGSGSLSNSIQDISTSHNGHFYLLNSHFSAPVASNIDVVDTTGAVLSTTAIDAGVRFLGSVTLDESKLWTGGSNTQKVATFDLSSHALTDVITEASYSRQTINNGVMALRDGTVIVLWQSNTAQKHLFVNHYSAAGALLHGYAVPDDAPFGPAGHFFTSAAPGLTDATVWFGTYEFDTSDYVRMRELDIATGTILHSFDKRLFGPTDFDWDSSFAVVRGTTSVVFQEAPCCRDDPKTIFHFIESDGAPLSSLFNVINDVTLVDHGPHGETILHSSHTGLTGKIANVSKTLPSALNECGDPRLEFCIGGNFNFANTLPAGSPFSQMLMQIANSLGDPETAIASVHHIVGTRSLLICSGKASTPTGTDPTTAPDVATGLVAYIKNVIRSTSFNRIEMRGSVNSEPGQADGWCQLKVNGRVYVNGDDGDLIDPSQPAADCVRERVDFSPWTETADVRGWDAFAFGPMGDAMCLYVKENADFCNKNKVLGDKTGGVTCDPPGPGGASYDGSARGERMIHPGGAEAVYVQPVGEGIPATAADVSDPQ